MAVIGPALTLAAVPAGALMAEAATSGGFDPYSLIGSVVTPVVVVALLLFGKLHTEADYQRLASELETARAAQERLQGALTDRVIPALTRSTLVLEAMSPMLQNEVRLRAATRSPDDVAGG